MAEVVHPVTGFSMQVDDVSDYVKAGWIDNTPHERPDNFTPEAKAYVEQKAEEEKAAADEAQSAEESDSYTPAPTVAPEETEA